MSGPRRASRGDFRTATTSTRAPPSRDGSISTAFGGGTAAATTKKTSSMILLAPRRVQEAFTSTTTTRKLEAHGLLDEKASGGETESRERARRHKEREKEKEKERQKEKEKERQKEKERRKKEKGKGKQSKDDSYLTSSEGSIASGSTLISSTLQPPPSSAPSLHTYPPGSTISLNSSISREGTFARTTSRNSSHTSRRRRRVHDPLDDSDDEDETNAQPTRTPHNEAYGTVDASVIEQLRSRQDRSHISDYDSNGGFFYRFIRGRTGPIAHGLSSGQVVSHYDPPWLTMVSRNRQEQQQRVVDNLNTSFKDVGLLPSTHKDKPQKQRKIASGNNKNVDIFEDVPPDSLYMLLPLWAGDTDPISERRGNIEKLVIPNEMRKYLLVYYNHDLPVEEKNRGEGESKKRSRNSPTSSHESNTKRDDRTSILLSTFHITGRLVSYKDLQGSGVRVPDEGLTITGPLDAAYRTMPSSVRDEGLFDFVLGMCPSREAGIEFVPDGFIKMGLCLQTSEPMEMPISEEDEAPNLDVELTPLGRAVLEMAWLGAMALTSFGPGT